MLGIPSLARSLLPLPSPPLSSSVLLLTTPLILSQVPEPTLKGYAGSARDQEYALPPLEPGASTSHVNSSLLAGPAKQPWYCLHFLTQAPWARTGPNE